MNCTYFKEALNGITVLCESDGCSYDDARKIKNARFDYKPFCIVKCKNTDDVVRTIKLCQSENKSVRIRSGGHQHEGMCSADDVVIIDLSGMNDISVCKEHGTAWIEPGTKLKSLYDKLQSQGYTLPGGGCDTVNVGGLVQGGGWGLLARDSGLTCDSLQEVELVTAKGKIIKATKDEHKNLFWAIKGGGGGNFGVITKYKFKLKKLSPDCQYAWLVSIRYSSKNDQGLLTKLLECYLNELENFENTITSFARISPDDDESDKARPTFTMTFQCLGRDLNAFKSVDTFLNKLQEKEREYNLKEKEKEKKCSNFFKSIRYSPKLRIAQAYTLLNNTALRKAASLETTCGSNSVPHKVSSAFPKGDIATISNNIVDFVYKHKDFKNAVTYLTIHSLGGKIKEISTDSSSFFYRDKEFLLQFQAWWEQPNDEKSDDYINWIRNFRQELDNAGCIEGAFINFPDRTLVKSSGDGKTDRIDLLKLYYGSNLDRLREIKAEYDPNNFFSFGMSIPPKEGERKKGWGDREIGR